MGQGRVVGIAQTILLSWCWFFGDCCRIGGWRFALVAFHPVGWVGLQALVV